MMVAEPASPGETLLSLSDIHKRYVRRSGLRRSTTRAVDGVSLELVRGRTLGLVGESGSGKSTLARVAAKLIDPTSGSVAINGRDVTRLSVRALGTTRRDVQMVFQDPFSSFDPTSRLGNSVVEPLSASDTDGSNPDAEAMRLLELVGLDPSLRHRYPHQLSGGQLQRAAIARALAPRPNIVVLDEPVSALDLSTQAQIVNLLIDLQAEMSPAYLFVAHDLAVVRHVSHRVAVMYKGRIVEEGPTEAIYGRPRHPYTIALISSVPGRHRRRSELRPSGAATPDEGCRFRLRCPDAMDICAIANPPATTVDDGVSVACHLFSDASGPSVETTSARSDGADNSEVSAWK